MISERHAALFPAQLILSCSSADHQNLRLFSNLWKSTEMWNLFIIIKNLTAVKPTNQAPGIKQFELQTTGTKKEPGLAAI